jgi:hypothetical protein
MKSFLLVLFMAAVPLALLGQSTAKNPASPAHPKAPASQEIQTEEIVAPGQTPAVPSAQQNTTGYLDPAQLKALTHRIWLAQYRLTDLLLQVHPEKWKLAPTAKLSFDQSLDSLHKSLAGEEDWRSQLDGRPDSLYLGFQTYMAISAVLPRVDGLAHTVSKYENPSFGGQFSQAANQLFDLQQLLEPHLAYLLKNQDNAMLIMQTNMAACQNELNYAEHNKEGHATPMKNIVPEFKGRKRNARATPAVSGGKAGDATNPPKDKAAVAQPKEKPNK